MSQMEAGRFLRLSLKPSLENSLIFYYFLFQVRALKGISASTDLSSTSFLQAQQ